MDDNDGDWENEAAKQLLEEECMDAIHEAKSKIDEIGTDLNQFEVPEGPFISPKLGIVRKEMTPQAFIGAKLCEGKFEIKEYIESGSFGRGWKALVTVGSEECHESNQNFVFVKTMRCKGDTEEEESSYRHKKRLELYKKEILFHAKERILLHKNIATNVVLYSDVVGPQGESANMFFFLSPHLCEGGELFSFVFPGFPKSSKARNFKEDVAKKVFIHIANGVAFLHSNEVYHRDLKLENIVLTNDFVAKITDFGSAKHIVFEDEADRPYTSTVIGTSQYKMKESRGGEYDAMAVDVWACGVVLLFLLGMEEIMESQERLSIVVKAVECGDIFNGEHRVDGIPINEPFWNDKLFKTREIITPQARSTINSMLDIVIARRATMSSVLGMPWMSTDIISDEEYFYKMREQRQASA